MSGHSPLSEPYWQGAGQNRLVLQRCSSCGRIRHYPRPMCDACFSFEVGPVEVERRGTVHSWTVTHHPFEAALAAEVPYPLVTVDVLDGVRLLGRFPGDGPLRIGMPVTFDFRPNAEGVPVPWFVPAAKGGS